MEATDLMYDPQHLSWKTCTSISRDLYLCSGFIQNASTIYKVDRGLGFLALQSPKKQLQLSFKATWWYWLSITKPKNAFRVTSLKISIKLNFLLSD